MIYSTKTRAEKLYRYLPRAKESRGRRYFKRWREPIGDRRSIHERPNIADTHQEFGHWEGDLMQFRTQRGNLLKLCKWKTLFIVTAPIKTKTAAETGKVLRRIFFDIPIQMRQSVTFDN